MPESRAADASNDNLISEMNENPNSRPREGIPLDLLVLDEGSRRRVQQLLASESFIGIDFGTSTTVVSRLTLDDHAARIVTEPIPIPQMDQLGRTIEDPLVPSCIAWHGGRVLVGRGAADLKPSLTAGKNLWFSFKMQLGVDLGPKYYNSQLKGPDAPVEILRDQDAARVFFAFLREKIEDFLKEKGLPGTARYAVSVPASFESNQRADLCAALEAAGIPVPAHAMIDEPNAAFISHIVDTLRFGPAVVDAFRDKPKDVLVFDFGAGTCDISVLRVQVVDEQLLSQNLAISQFRALGGDNIDRQIAKKILWPAMRQSCAPGHDFREAAIGQVILPRLQGSAEQLKIQCCKSISTRWNGSDSSPFREKQDRVQAAAVPPFTLTGVELGLPAPSISFAEFFNIMEPFLDAGEVRGHADDSDLVSIFDPIDSALDKASIAADEVDMVLFIGGSAQNPLVYEAIRNRFGRFVECVINEDTRTPVSRGAAVHAFAIHGLGVQLIRSITSEPIYVVTVGDRLTQILPAGTPMPSDDIAFSDGLEVQNDGQRLVQLPICVSSRTKTLGMLEIRPPRSQPLKKGDAITMTCRIDENKLIRITAKVGSALATTALINPLANEELAPGEVRRLMARQRLNESIVEGGGKPAAAALEDYADACMEAEKWTEAAEALENLEKISPGHRTGGNATGICYAYSKAGRQDRSDKWAETAFDRRPTWVSAYNLALRHDQAGRVQRADTLFRQALDLGPDQPVVLSSYGERLLKRGDREAGEDMLERALELFLQAREFGTLESNDIWRLEHTARLLKRSDLIDEIRRWGRAREGTGQLYKREFLASPRSHEDTIKPF